MGASSSKAVILIFEQDLIWSSRLTKSLGALGYESRTVKSTPEDLADVTGAIVNLGVDAFVAEVPKLTSQGVHVIGHAGHKEKDLHELGREAGCQTLATNSELTYKIESLVKNAGM